MVACTPLLINPIAFAACEAGCAALADSDNTEEKGSPVFLPDGTVAFEKESAKCAGICSPLNADKLAYAACLGGCAGVDKKRAPSMEI